MDCGTISGATTASSVVHTTIQIAQVFYELKAVGQQTRDLLDSTQHVYKNLQTARTLRRQKSLHLDVNEKKWIDGVILNTEKTVENVAALIEPARVSMQTNFGRISLLNRGIFVFRDSPKVTTHLARLGLTGGTLDAVLNVLCTREGRPSLLAPHHNLQTSKSSNSLRSEYREPPAYREENTPDKSQEVNTVLDPQKSSENMQFDTGKKLQKKPPSRIVNQLQQSHSTPVLTPMTPTKQSSANVGAHNHSTSNVAINEKIPIIAPTPGFQEDDGLQVCSPSEANFFASPVDFRRFSQTSVGQNLPGQSHNGRNSLPEVVHKSYPQQTPCQTWPGPKPPYTPPEDHQWSQSSQPSDTTHWQQQKQVWTQNHPSQTFPASPPPENNAQYLQQQYNSPNQTAPQVQIYINPQNNPHSPMTNSYFRPMTYAQPNANTNITPRWTPTETPNLNSPSPSFSSSVSSIGNLSRMSSSSTYANLLPSRTEHPYSQSTPTLQQQQLQQPQHQQNSYHQQQQYQQPQFNHNTTPQTENNTLPPPPPPPRKPLPPLPLGSSNGQLRPSLGQGQSEPNIRPSLRKGSSGKDRGRAWLEYQAERAGM